MKTKLLSLLAVLVLAPAALVAADFEGKVGFKMTGSGGRAQDIKYAVKAGKFRVEMAGPQGPAAMIMDPAKKEMTMIMDQQRMYMTMALPDAAPAADQSKAGEGPKLEKTGETEEILGYTGEKYIATDRDQKTELWLTDALGAFMGFGNPGGGMGGRRGGGSSAQAWEKALAGKSLFPLRVVGHDAANKETFRMEVTSIEKQTLADDLFAPPAGYQKLDMGMMQGMPGGMPGGMRPPTQR